MSRNKLIPYNSKLREYARELRKNSTLSEILLWQKIQRRALGVQFHRQVPLLDYIVDFYCHELQLAIEIDGNSHDFRYDEDQEQQGALEKRGVNFIRFTDEAVKKNMFSVILALEKKVAQLSRDLNITITEHYPPEGENIPNNPPSKGEHKFPKKEKLKSRKRIEQLFAEGKAITQYPIKLIYLKHDSDQATPFQVGFSAPKKKFKLAVHRNRIKRLLREAYRLHKHTIFNNSEGNFALLFLYLGKDLPPYTTIEVAMKKLLAALTKEISNKMGSSDT